MDLFGALSGTSRNRVIGITLAGVLTLGAAIGCRTNPGVEGERTPTSRCDEEAPGTLRVANSSGRTLDVYVARPDARPQLLTQVSPGTSSVTVPGPTDLGVRYDVIDVNAQQRLATVSWLRRTAREVAVGVIAELTCAGGGSGPGAAR